MREKTMLFTGHPSVGYHHSMAEPDRRMRRDAQERREALILAAEACFAESGFLVPLEDIADRAGVGRGTLYRNFKNRLDLALAIFEREIDKAAGRVDPTAPLAQIILALVEKGAHIAALFARLTVEIPLDDESHAAFKSLRGRFGTVLEPIVARAHAEGTLRADADTETLLLAIAMISHLRAWKFAEDREGKLRDAVDLVLRGLLPR
jgi:AcrR family transcriptional regulator